MRFGVLSLLCTLSLITYLDRFCFQGAKEDINRDLGLSDLQIELLNSAFMLGYLLFEAPSGWMGDTWGSRRVLTRIVLWWSAFMFLTGCVWPFVLDSGVRLPFFGATIPLLFDAFLLLLLIRFLFGCGEAGAYPNMSRVVGGWFPFRERGLAQGAIWTCARIGGAVAPFTVGRLTANLGWRPAFWVLSCLGLVWCVFFFRWFRNTPEEKPQCNDAERELIGSGPYGEKGKETGHGHAMPHWRSLLLSGNLWALYLAAAGVSFGWYFYGTSLKRFLQEAHGIGRTHSEILAGLPFLTGAVGAGLGGWVSDHMIRRAGRRWGRSLIGLFGFAGAAVCFFAGGIATVPWLAVTLLCLATFINDLAVPVIWAVSTDISGRYAGTVCGLMNMMGGLGPIVSMPLVPWLRDHHQVSWPAVMAILAAGWLIGALAWLRIDASEQLFPEESPH